MHPNDLGKPKILVIFGSGSRVCSVERGAGWIAGMHQTNDLPYSRSLGATSQSDFNQVFIMETNLIQPMFRTRKRLLMML